MEFRKLYLQGRKSFEENGFECPGIEARAILARSLNTDPLEIYAHPEKKVGTEGAQTFEKLLRRRLSGEPLAYITGRREFYSRNFSVTPDVLIPRPETETLAELAIETARGMNSPRILDLATGSGCLAVTLCGETDNCEIFASDVSSAALCIAAENARAHGARIRFIRSDFLGCFAESSFDMIISNPPYVSEAQYAKLPGEIKNHEPSLALLGGEDGLSCIKKIAGQAGEVLRTGGFMLLEIGAGQAGDVERTLGKSGFSDISSRNDTNGIKRVVKATWKK